jgi:hypothetical protein
MKRDINEFVSQKCWSKYYTVNKLPGFLDAKNANLFVMYIFANIKSNLSSQNLVLISI